MSLAFARERGNTETVIRTLNNLGLAHQALSADPVALNCFDEALQLSHRTFRKHDEANTLISLGNYYLEANQAAKAKECFEHALEVAREAEDIEMEEGSILSLGYAHRSLGTTGEIVGEFKAVAERAGEMQHYENLVGMLTFAGEVNLEEGECRASAEMFDQALMVAVVLSADRIEQLGSSFHDSKLLPEFTQVIVSICKAINQAILSRRVTDARELNDSLLYRLQQKAWGETGHVVRRFLNPISDYLAKLPPQSVGEFLAAAWRKDEGRPMEG